MSATKYLFAVQDPTGREVCSASLAVQRVSDVTAVREGDTVDIHLAVDQGSSLVATGEYTGDGELSLLRWDADNKLAEPVRKAVPTSA